MFDFNRGMPTLQQQLDSIYIYDKAHPMYDGVYSEKMKTRFSNLVKFNSLCHEYGVGYVLQF